MDLKGEGSIATVSPSLPFTPVLTPSKAQADGDHPAAGKSWWDGCNGLLSTALTAGREGALTKPHTHAQEASPLALQLGNCQAPALACWCVLSSPAGLGPRQVPSYRRSHWLPGPHCGKRGRVRTQVKVSSVTIPSLLQQTGTGSPLVQAGVTAGCSVVRLPRRTGGRRAAWRLGSGHTGGAFSEPTSLS